MAGPKFTPYATGAGPLPNDEYGDGHMQVDPRFAPKTNSAIAGVHPTDSNMSGAPSNRSMDQIMQQGMQMFGPDVFMQIMDDVLRVAASQDVNGQMAPPFQGSDFYEQQRQDEQMYYETVGTSRDPSHPDYHEMMRQDEESYYDSQLGTKKMPQVPGSIAPKRGMMGRKIN